MGEVVEHPSLRLLFDYWLAKRQNRLMPSRADIDPIELPGRVWQHLMLIEVARENEHLRFRYRLVGTHFEEAYGRKLAGEYVDEALDIQGDYKTYIIDIFTEVVVQRRPLYTVNNYILTGQSVPTLTRRLSLPLSDDGAIVNMTLSGHVFERPIGDPLTFDTGVRSFHELRRYVYASDRWMAASRP